MEEEEYDFTDIPVPTFPNIFNILNIFGPASQLIKNIIDDTESEKVNEMKQVMDEYLNIIKEKDPVKLENLLKTKLKLDSLEQYPQLISIINNLNNTSNIGIDNAKILIDNLFSERQIEPHDEEYITSE